MYKRKAGYRLKKGESGLMRWHKLPEKEKNKSLPSKVPQDLTKTLNGGRGGRQASALLKEYTDNARLENIKARDRIDYTGLGALSAVNSNVLTEIRDPMNIRVHTHTPDIGWRVDPKTGIMIPDGIGSGAFTNYYQRMNYLHERTEGLKGQTSIANKAKYLFGDNVDMSLTPHLPTMSSLIENADPELFDDLFDDIGMVKWNRDEAKRTGALSYIHDAATIRSFRRELIKPFSSEELLRDEDAMPHGTPDALFPTKGFPLHRRDGRGWTAEVRGLGPLSSQYMKEATYHSLRTGVHKAAEDFLDEAERVGMDVPAGMFIGRGYQLFGGQPLDQISPDNKFMDRQLAIQERKGNTEVIKKFQRLEELAGEEYDDTLQEARIARAWTTMLTVKRLTDYGLKPGTAASGAIYNDLYNKTKITFEPEVMGTARGFSSNKFKNNYNNSRGSKVTPFGSTVGLPNASNMLAGYSGIAMHELTHAADDLLTSIDQRAAGATDDSVFMSPDAPAKAIKAAEYRDKMADDIMQIAGESLALYRQSVGKRGREGHDVIAEAGYMYGALPRSHPSPIFLVPEFERLAYIATSGTNGPLEIPHTDRFDYGYDSPKKRGNGVRFDAFVHPETVTVLTEYALGAPHVLEALDKIYGTRLRENLNNYYGVSVVKKSDPALLANTMVNLEAHGNYMRDPQNAKNVYRDTWKVSANAIRKSERALHFQLKPYTSDVKRKGMRAKSNKA